MQYAPRDHWDRFFKRKRLRNAGLDWGEQWIGPFRETLRELDPKKTVDLGCGTGNEVIGLAVDGFRTVGLDYSREAIASAKAKPPSDQALGFLVADMAQELPFVDGSFDAVMSNVAVHMISDRVTQTIFSEVRRVLRRDGLFLFHVNSAADRPLREKRSPMARELEENFILEETGQTMHFFSREYLLELFSTWKDVRLDHVEVPLAENKNEVFKCVWRGIARA